MPFLALAWPYVAGAVGLGIVAKTAGDEIGEGIAKNIPLVIGAAALYFYLKKRG